MMNLPGGSSRAGFPGGFS